MNLDIEELFELEDVNTEFYMAGYCAAVVSYLVAGIVFVETYNIFRFAMFVTAFFPLLYGFKKLMERPEIGY